jgi:hypothetical protein
MKFDFLMSKKIRLIVFYYIFVLKYGKTVQVILYI